MAHHVKFLKDHPGERYHYAEGHIVSVGDGHSPDAIPEETAAELLKADTVEKVSAADAAKYHEALATPPVAPPEEKAVKGASGRASAAEHPSAKAAKKSDG
jgi:hypothetical protein